MSTAVSRIQNTPDGIDLVFPSDPGLKCIRGG